MKPRFYTVSRLVFFFLSTGIAWAQDATEIVRRADKKMQGESNESIMTMKIVRPTWERTLEFKNWSKGSHYSLTLITAPAREKGQSFLKRNTELWHWNPAISRMIKLPPSMMSEGWMGSDYTNDDILKESSIINDYAHKLLRVENYTGYDCYVIELIPKEEAAVVWGKIVKWISKEGYFQLKSEYYDEDFELVRTEQASKILKMDDREIPTMVEIIPANKSNQRTIITINTVRFNTAISDNFFTQQNLKTVR